MKKTLTGKPCLPAGRALLRGLTLALSLVFCAVAARTEVLPPVPLAPAEINRLGERMYRNGILPSGRAMASYSGARVEAGSTAYSCSSCHLRAGLGSVEGVVVTPAATGAKLYQPHRVEGARDLPGDLARRSPYARGARQRPAYDRDSLARVLRSGVDPAGRVLNDAMPRYPLSDADMAILIAYLEGLSSQPSPGASGGAFRFATIVTDDVSRQERQELLQALNSFVDQKNQQAGMYRDYVRLGYSPTVEMQYAFHQVTLDVWELTGEPRSWPAQLAGYYRKNPVFAVLGGISHGDWRPIHDFCEENRLPCLFPITDFPAVSETGWYTYYYNKGYYQEGEAVARYLDRWDRLPAAAPVLQVVQDSPAGRALAAGFQGVWNELERPAVISVTLGAEKLRDRETLAGLVERHRPGVLLLWTDAGALPLLPALAGWLAAPGALFLSSSYLGKAGAGIPEKLRPSVYLSYPYRLTPFTGTKDGGFDAKVPILAQAKDLGSLRIGSRTTSMLRQIVLRGLNLLYDNLYRDHLLDVLSMQMDLTVLDYEKLNFGVGQRYVSRGCYVIQLGPGAEPPLIPRSEWIIH